MHSDTFPITKSFLSEKALAHQIEKAYSLSDVRCQLLTSTMRDVYLVTSAQGKNIFYIYRHNQRTMEEIVDEWRFVAYLFANNIPVAPAILSNKGEFLLAFNAPEGIRYGVLTTYVEGEHFRRRPSTQAAMELGRAIGQIHDLSDKMPFKLNRPSIEVHRQLEQYVATFALEFPERKEDIAYLHRAVDYILAKVAELPTTSPHYGIIHGDVIRSNVQVGENNKITLLDFDLCGLGWRAYDIATFLLTLHGPNSREYQQAYLGGYNGVRQLDTFEQELIPLFKMMRAVVTIGIPVMNLHHWGKANIEPWFKYSFANIEQGIKQFDR